MREYDGVDYRYKSGAPKSDDAIKFLSNLLGFPPNTSALEYELNLYAGGIGVDDRLAFCCAMSEKEVVSATKKLRLIPPTDALSDPEWGEEFAWLVGDGVDLSSIITPSINFINQNKKTFQKSCSAGCLILFARESNVNTWAATWFSEGIFNYLSFDQG